MAALSTLFLSLSLLCPAHSQPTGPGGWLVQVDGYGLARLDHADLRQALADLSGRDAGEVASRRLALFHRGKAVPILVEDGGDGRFGPGDRVLFFSIEPAGLFNNSNLYTLVLDESRQATLAPATAPPAEPAPQVEDRGREVGATVLQRLNLTGPKVSLSLPGFVHLFAPVLADGKRHLYLEGKIYGDKGMPESIQVKTAGRARTVKVPESGRFRLPYDHDLDSGPDGNIKVTVEGVGENRIGLAMKAEQAWNNMMTLSLTKKGPGLLALRGLARTDLMAYLVRGHKLIWTGWRQTDGRDVLALALPEGKHRVLLATAKGMIRPRRVFRTPPSRPLAPAGTTAYLALAPRHLLPALDRHLARRRQDLGSARAVALEQVYNHYSQGQPDPAAIRTWLQETGKGLRHLLLVGPARKRNRGWRGLPYHGPASRWDTFATCPPLPYLPKGEKDREPYAVDALYGDLDGDGLSEVSVGRIPCRTPQEVQQVLAKTAAYEKRSQPGPTARRVFIQGGLGRYNSRGGNKLVGSMLESMLEGVARNFVDRWVPPYYDLEAIFSSPSSSYFFAPDRFRQQVSAGLAKGFCAGFYIGHGARREYDTFRWRKKTYKTFLAEDAAALEIEGQQGIYFALTCLSGTIAMRGEEPCMAGELCLNPRGPVCAVGSSGTVADKLNLLAIVATLEGFFEQRKARMGELLHFVQANLEAKLKDPELAMIIGMIDQVRKARRSTEEMLKLGRYQYTLYGDPALNLRYPGKGIAIEPVPPATLGEEVTVKGVAPGLTGGKVWISLELPRHQPREKLQPLSPQFTDGTAQVLLARNNKMMNHRCLVLVQVPLVKGRFRATVKLPATVPGGKLLIQVFASGPEGCLAGCLHLPIKGD